MFRTSRRPHSVHDARSEAGATAGARRSPAPLRTLLVPILALAALALATAAAAAPQEGPGEEEPRIRDLTGRQVESEELVDVLRPEGPPPEGAFQTRGGARSLSPPGRTSCAEFSGTRGFTVRPAADVAAIEVLFEFDSAELTPRAEEALDEVAAALTDSSLATCCFRIEGHTDAVGSEAYNRELSERRAESVVRYLARRHGIDDERLLVVGFGETRPIADNDSDAGRRKNRRVQLVNLGYGRVEP